MGGGPASSSSGRVGLLQRVLRQRILLAGQWNLLRMEEQGLLPGLLCPIAQLLQGCPGSAFCSPVSGTCYAWKNKAYYETCAAQSSSDSGAPSGFLALLNTANETASPDVNRSASGEEG